LVGGLRVQFPIAKLKTFMVFHGGLARITERYEPNLLGLERGSFMHGLLEGGIGLSVPLTERLALESTYRYGRIVGTNGFNVQALGAGIAFGF
jgi:hypothetical protein